MAKKKIATEEIPFRGKMIPLKNGGEVHLYPLDDQAFGWRLVNKEGDVTMFSVTREAMNAMIALHAEVVWGPWKVTEKKP